VSAETGKELARQGPRSETRHAPAHQQGACEGARDELEALRDGGYRKNRGRDMLARSKSIARTTCSGLRGLSTPSFDIKGTLRTDGLKVGNYAEVRHTFDQTTVTDFADICGDNNPLHIDPVFAKTTMFKGTIVHGILVSSLFSTLFGRAIHGSVYVSQSLSFKKPVHVGSAVIARMQILEMEERRSGMMIKCSTVCTLDNGGASHGVVAVEGEAKVLIPGKKTVKN